MPLKTAITVAAMLFAAPAAAQDSARLGGSAFADPYERAYGGPDDRGREGDRALAAYYGYGTYISPFDRDYRWPERLQRDRDGSLSYDRDYPYDFRYGGQGVRSTVAATTSDAHRRIGGDILVIERGVRVYRGGGRSVRFED